MHEAEGESDLISFFLHDPLKFMMGWRDIFSQHMHDALTGQDSVRTRPCTSAHIRAADNLIGALTHARVATAYTDTKSFLHPRWFRQHD